MALVGFLFGIVVTPPAIFLAIVSAGAGHGHYVFARAFFPLPMLATLFTNDEISIPLMIAAAMQYPIYGLVTGYAFSKHGAFAVFIIAFHLITVIVAFSGLIPNFS